MEMDIDAITIRKRNSIQVPFELRHFKGTSQETALLDTGATESFIDIKIVKRLNLGSQELDNPRPVFNVDGSANKHGTITCATHLLITQGNKKQQVPFYVTNLGDDCFILGYPWCQDFKPDINWANSKLKGPRIHMETLLFGKVQHLHQKLNETLKAKENDDLVFTVSAAITQESPEEALEELEESIQPDNNNDESLWSGVTTPEMECGQVEFIRHTHNAVEMAHKYAETHAKEEIKLPERFKQHAALFSDEEAKKFLPSRPHNHKIELIEDAPAQFNMKVYPLSAKEQEAEDKFLDENLEKGYIIPSDSPYGFATFQVPKKDSNKQHYIIDYRPLNKVTRRDITPLPNLAQCIEDLQGMELFSKFDIRWGYNNIRIHEEDQWKAAFKTCRGLFEPRVMFFSMSNSPGSFQCFINYILEPWYKKFGQKKGKNYMDDIGIGTKLSEWKLHKDVTATKCAVTSRLWVVTCVVESSLQCGC